MTSRMDVPFFRVCLGEDEIKEVTDVLRSGWLTTGARVRRFEEQFTRMLGLDHAVAVNSCTAALHLALEAAGVQPGDGILVPTHTFAATAEVVRYLGAYPILVDCCSDTLNMDLADAERKIADVRSGRLDHVIPPQTRITGMIPVHVAGYMMDLDAINAFAAQHGIWFIEDAAHAFPAAWRSSPDGPWQVCGSGNSKAACFSFYANKTITTGEGGMLVTQDEDFAARVRVMSLHGLSKDAWSRYSGGGSWDYRIIAPGFKYNMTDIAAAIGIHQLERAEVMRLDRVRCATYYRQVFMDSDAFDLPLDDACHTHAWHLFPIRLNLNVAPFSRDVLVEKMKENGVSFSVHWRPLHMHPYYQNIGWRSEDCPTATAVWPRLISLPIFYKMTDTELEYVAETLLSLTKR
ncbi:DegT/DnrJ/EryC1/StrS family aminotransferase [bacterium]|nr:DegT/DnrJ/EryC1/StrS family aminotransferase [candidate division CSSED10-310 bacterium]